MGDSGLNENTEADIYELDKPERGICGFWRRIIAFVVDVVFLGIFGMAMGTVCYDLFVLLGTWGTVVGFFVALAYFGICCSRICDGQTLGKRLLKIRVVDKRGTTISPARSLMRYSVIGIPYFLNGAHVPPVISNSTLVSHLIGLTVFFGLGSIVYLYLFNQRTRQSLHDLIVGSYVVNAGYEKEISPVPIWKGHLVIACLLLISIAAGFYIMPDMSNSRVLDDIKSVQEDIRKTGLVHYADVSVGKSFGVRINDGIRERWESSYVNANVFLKGKPGFDEHVINRIASVIIFTFPRIMEKDAVIINAFYGYDIGIARAWKGSRKQFSPEEWRKILSGNRQGVTI